MTPEEEIKKIEDEIQRTQYNKATQGHIGRLKAKLAKLKESASKKGGGGGLGYAVKKTGDATVILVGLPSVGKSTLLNNLTNADSKVGGYEFTTLTVIPGMLEYRGARIQILDIPGIIESASEGKGRGKEVLSVARNADLLMVITSGETKDVKKQKEMIVNELYSANFRLNQRPPDVKIMKKNEGGLKVETTKKLNFNRDTIIQILKEFKIHNAEILIREKITLDQFIDCLSKNRLYIPALFIANKTDKYECTDNSFIKISALKASGIEKIKESIWSKLELKRIYMKRPGKDPDMKEPLIMRGRVTVKIVCEKFHLLENFKFAKIWGPSSKFPGQKIGLEQVLRDKDIVEIHN